MIKMFVSDLDGTLLGMDQHIDKQDKQAIKRLVAQGITFAVASGRMDHEIREVLKRLGVTGHRVSQNGAFVINQEDLDIYTKTFDKTMAAKLMTAIDAEPMIKTVSTSDQTFTEQRNKWVDLISEQLFHDIQIEPKLREQFGTTIIPSKISLHGREKDVTKAYERISEAFGDEIDCFISHESCVDLMPKAVNKGTGLKSLMKTLNINPDEIVCIGDSFNDLSMFALTPNSYAMSTAHPEVQKQAAHVVDHVHEAIEDLEKKGFIPKVS